MEPHLYRTAVMITALLALGRAAAIHYFWVTRLMAYRKRAVATPMTWSDLVTYPEPPLLIAVTVFMWLTHSNPPEPSALELVRVGVAASVASAAMALQIWALRSIPGVSPGHYVLPEQEVSAAGAFGFVRHPLYLGAIIVWLSVALGFGSLSILLVTTVYVIPSYIIFSRSEERMMIEHMGDGYREYRERVGGFLPRRLRRSDRHSSGG